MTEDLLRRGVAALERIAAALEVAVAMAPEPPAALRGCAHPQEHCVDLGGMGEGALVHCTLCRQDVMREAAHV